MMINKDFKHIVVEDVIEWCKANNQVEWLKAKSKEMVDYKVYPRIETTNKDGKTVYKADKTQKPTIKKDRISFIQLKTDFCAKFMPEKLPKAAEAKPTMYDLIDAL